MLYHTRKLMKKLQILVQFFHNIVFFYYSLPNTVLVKLPSGEVKKTTLKQGQVEVTKISKPTTSGSALQKPLKSDQKTDKKEVMFFHDNSCNWNIIFRGSAPHPRWPGNIVRLVAFWGGGLCSAVDMFRLTMMMMMIVNWQKSREISCLVLSLGKHLNSSFSSDSVSYALEDLCCHWLTLTFLSIPGCRNCRQ